MGGTFYGCANYPKCSYAKKCLVPLSAGDTGKCLHGKCSASYGSSFLHVLQILVLIPLDGASTQRTIIDIRADAAGSSHTDLASSVCCCDPTGMLRF